MIAALNLFERTKITSFVPLLIGLASIAALAASARIQVPMIPVPVTLQTAVVLMLPCILGYRMALAVLAGYFAAGLLGAPVFANGAGPAYFAGPTGGYLAGFAAAVMTMGAALRYKEKWTFVPLTCLMMAGHAVILICGALWLAYGIPSLGATQAIAAGIVPFLGGSIMKSLIAAAFVKAIK